MDYGRCILHRVVSSWCNLPPVMQAVDGLSLSSGGFVNPNDSSVISCHVLGSEGKNVGFNFGPVLDKEWYSCVINLNLFNSSHVNRQPPTQPLFASSREAPAERSVTSQITTFSMIRTKKKQTKQKQNKRNLDNLKRKSKVYDQVIILAYNLHPTGDT